MGSPKGRKFSRTIQSGRIVGAWLARPERLLALKRGLWNARNRKSELGNTWQDLGSPLPWAGVDAWGKELHRDFESELPERPGCAAANRFLIKASKFATQQAWSAKRQ
jgi:hypothetical protein